MKTDTKIDNLLSSEGGMMKGTNVAFVGDPGVGKTTVLLDMLANLHKNGNKVLFISGEMTQIDMVGMVKRFPKFGSLPILILTVFDITFIIINYLQCKYTIPISGNQIFRARKKKA